MAPYFVMKSIFLVLGASVVMGARALHEFDSSDEIPAKVLHAEEGTRCLSSAKVECTLGTIGDFLNSGLPKIPCEDNLRLKRSDCPLPTSKVEQNVVITWTYCNKDTVLAVPIAKKTTAKYKGWMKEDLPTAPLMPGECTVAHHEKTLNLCVEHAASCTIKYEGKLPDRSNAYCYGYSFLKVRRTWLNEGCSISADVSCTIRGGEKDGEQCNGNVIRQNAPDGSCLSEDIPVKWSYKHCFWNTDGSFSYENRKNNIFSKIKLNGKIFALKNKNDHPSTEKCRLQSIENTINTCKNGAASRLYIEGNLRSGEECTAFAFERVRTDEMCSYDFLITEIIDPSDDPKHRYVEIKTESCAGRVVLEDIKIVKFLGGNPRPNQLGPISLLGKKIPDDGFFVFCTTGKGSTFYGGDSVCDDVTLPGSAADSDGWDQIAIIKGPIEGPYEILDLFGRIREKGEGTDHDFRDSRVVRKVVATSPSGKKWIPNNWIIHKAADSNSADPRVWRDETPTRTPSSTPSSSPSILPTESSSPSSKPTKSNVPSTMPTESSSPSIMPTKSNVPSTMPTKSSSPSALPTESNAPSTTPTESQFPTFKPSQSRSPTLKPTEQPSAPPSKGKGEKGEKGSKGEGEAKG